MADLIIRRNVPTGWLSPEGQLYECDYFEHLSLAREIAEKIGASYEELYLADKYLLNNGWVHLSITMFLGHGWLVTFPEIGTISQEQRQFLKPYVEDNMDFISDINADLRIEFAELFYGESE